MSETSENLSTPSAVESSSNWAVSFCFWMSLTVAAVTYGAVALAPKLSIWLEARTQYSRNGAELSELEDRVAYLERVKVTLETDPEFVRRLSQSSNPDQTLLTDKDSIPVSGNLLFGAHVEPIEVTSGVAESSSHADSGLVFQLASNLRLRAGLLIFAATLTIFSFTFLNDAGADLVNLAGRAIKAIAMIPVSRYLSHDTTTADSN